MNEPIPESSSPIQIKDLSKEQISQGLNRPPSTNVSNRIKQGNNENPNNQFITYTYQDSCIICLYLIFFIVAVEGMALIIYGIVCKDTIYIFPGVVFLVISSIFLSVFSAYSQFTIDKTKSIFIIHQKKICIICCKNCVKIQSFNINQIKRAEIRCINGKRGRSYSLVMKLNDDTIATQGVMLKVLVNALYKKKEI